VQTHYPLLTDEKGYLSLAEEGRQPECDNNFRFPIWLHIVRRLSAFYLYCCVTRGVRIFRRRNQALLNHCYDLRPSSTFSQLNTKYETEVRVQKCDGQDFLGRVNPRKIYIYIKNKRMAC
jgi:hypothetical protein